MLDTSRVLPPDAPAWLRGSAVDLAHAIRAGAVTCRAAVATCLARIDAVNPALNAVVARRTDAAMAEAERDILADLLADGAEPAEGEAVPSDDLPPSDDVAVGSATPGLGTADTVPPETADPAE
ncbi:MAG: hypothetical protein ACLGHP_06890, partial [Vicinamibacteria bacterium]